MSAEPATAGAPQSALDEGGKGQGGLSTKAKVFIALGLYLAVAILLLLIFPSEGKNEAFKPQNEFKLDPWISIHLGGLDLSVNKAVLYLFLASALTIFTMVWIARRMVDRPNRVQAAVEVAYHLTKDTITGGSLQGKTASRWFPFIAALFFWIWFSNMLGFLPLPINTEHPVDVFGLEVPAFAIYAATANIAIPLVLTLVVWLSYHVEGIRNKGFLPYFKSWLPPGLEDMHPIGKGAIFVIEVISHFVRLISLSVRLFANILAGHLLLLFMGGGLAVLLGIAALGALTFPLAFAFFIFEVGLVATLQAFIFSTLSAIYIGGATSAAH
ncbi:MAG TPA: F0F1 ATP synthase subunit A [Solirubrobacterales bacterium]|nr:F0F1 ATP synthase subunit A [Solirubrobacterales bacterium]